MKKTVTTNATLLSAPRVDWLLAHGFYPAISLDGDRAMHDLTRPFADRVANQLYAEGNPAFLQRFYYETGAPAAPA